MNKQHKKRQKAYLIKYSCTRCGNSFNIGIKDLENIWGRQMLLCGHHKIYIRFLGVYYLFYIQGFSYTKRLSYDHPSFKKARRKFNKMATKYTVRSKA